MEFVRKLGFLIFLFFVFISCKTSQLTMITLTEIKPLPKEVIIEKKLEYEPIYTNMKILEVSEVNGVQKNIIAKIESDIDSIQVDMLGEISYDNAFSEIIGTVKVTGIRGGFLEGVIESSTHKIPVNSYLRFQIGQKAIEK